MQTYKELKLYSLGIFQYAVVVEVLRTLFTSFSVKAHKHANFETFEVFEMSSFIIATQRSRLFVKKEFKSNLNSFFHHYSFINILIEIL
jgi:hypothetical protein